jgi:hypothetical protein
MPDILQVNTPAFFTSLFSENHAFVGSQNGKSAIAKVKNDKNLMFWGNAPFYRSSKYLDGQNP